MSKTKSDDEMSDAELLADLKQRAEQMDDVRRHIQAALREDPASYEGGFKDVLSVLTDDAKGVALEMLGAATRLLITGKALEELCGHVITDLALLLILPDAGDVKAVDLRHQLDELTSLMTVAVERIDPWGERVDDTRRRTMVGVLRLIAGDQTVERSLARIERISKEER